MTEKVEGSVSHRVTVAGTDLAFDVAPGERILTAARRAGVWLPFECGWGSCGTCKVTVVEGETELLLPSAPSYNPRDERRRRVIACQSTALTDLVIQPLHVATEPGDERPVVDRVGVLVAREELGPDLARFTFDVGSPAVFRPGQHALFDLGEGVRRCYSIANLPGSDRVQFIAKNYGRPGTARFFALSVGDEVPLEFPYGEMYLREGAQPLVLVAGGTGISAILALALQLAQAGERRPVTVFYGARTREELICWDELAAALERLPSAELVGSLALPDADWTGVVGHVTDALAPRLDSLVGARFYVAGPPVMTNAAVDMLRDRGVQLTDVHFDAFG